MKRVFCSFTVDQSPVVAHVESAAGHTQTSLASASRASAGSTQRASEITNRLKKRLVEIALRELAIGPSLARVRNAETRTGALGAVTGLTLCSTGPAARWPGDARSISCSSTKGVTNSGETKTISPRATAISRRIRQTRTHN